MSFIIMFFYGMDSNSQTKVSKQVSIPKTKLQKQERKQLTSLEKQTYGTHITHLLDDADEFARLGMHIYTEATIFEAKGYAKLIKLDISKQCVTIVEKAIKNSLSNYAETAKEQYEEGNFELSTIYLNDLKRLAKRFGLDYSKKINDWYKITTETDEIAIDEKTIEIVVKYEERKKQIKQEKLDEKGEYEEKPTTKPEKTLESKIKQTKIPPKQEITDTIFCVKIYYRRMDRKSDEIICENYKWFGINEEGFDLNQAKKIKTGSIIMFIGEGYEFTEKNNEFLDKGLIPGMKYQITKIEYKYK